ncbi:MAG: hypothetical protein JW761_13095, partial [Prolixibacteraceae bacterium]|nr:hypothetical protein [Prolixibacteraceae bacterium]
MRWAIFVVIYLVAINSVNGQKRLFTEGIEGDAAINIASDEIKKSFTPLPADFVQLKSVSGQKSDIEVTFIDFPQSARAAFLYAVSIWETILSSPVPIHIMARWDSLGNTIVAESRPSLSFRTFEGAMVSDVYYPVTLVEKLVGEEVNPGEPDIICSFNKNMPWYFGTDGSTPDTRYDFVTAVLHEITHGLGFYGFLKDNDGIGFFNNVSSLPSIYDYYIFNELNQQISDKTLFNSPSAELHHQLTSNKLKLYKVREMTASHETLEWIYAPEQWVEGSSIYHFKETAVGNELMSVEIKKGQAIHYPGEKTLKVLSELGWESVSFVFNEIKDFETPVENMLISAGVVADMPLLNSSFRLIYSTSYFSSADTVQLVYNPTNRKFEGEMPLRFFQGVVQYYFEVNSADGRIFRFPSTAPEKKLDFRVGPDYYPPEIRHNPLKIISENAAGFELSAMVTDNISVKNVKVEWKVNGVVSEFALNGGRGDNFFSGSIPLVNNLNSSSRIEYRLVAEDGTALKNKSTKPAVGYYQVEFFEALEPVSSYQNSFNSSTGDFLLSDFLVSKPVGFADGSLHTVNPYQTSEVDNENYNHYAVLKYPVVIKNGGLIKFDEIVLVEPGEPGTNYHNSYFWDYVIVEGSKDGGKTWLPLTDGYDSHISADWSSAFQSSVINNMSVAAGWGEMYMKHTINITEDADFYEGDVVIFRFRLASDNSVNGWGWAIDNLEIQQTYTGA